ncbi:replication initiation protein [Faucicola atlantae]|uniref:replication initiation protein n=1 Tax=Faucicola atlantae TaxID=34059 RepID=UPI000829D1B3|nr:replication initiation protein [Moraxella atlantae]
MNESRELIVLDNALITSAYSLSLNEQRLILAALKQIPPKTKIDAKTPFYITRDDFLAVGAEPTNVAKEIRQATKDLIKKTVTIKRPDGDLEVTWLTQVLRFNKDAETELRKRYPNDEDYNKYINGLRYYNLLDNIPTRKIDDNIVARLVFNDDLLPLISDLHKSFTKFLAKDVAGLQSVYSVRIYQLLMQYNNNNNGSGWVHLSLDDLRFMFKLQNKYSNVKDLKVRVLDTACREITAKTPYDVSYSMQKKGRKFDSVRFEFKRKANTAIDEKPRYHPWLEKGLSDAQINKLKVHAKIFVEGNRSMIDVVNLHQSAVYDDYIDAWRDLLKNPNTLLEFDTDLIANLLALKRGQAPQTPAVAVAADLQEKQENQPATATFKPFDFLG